MRGPMWDDIAALPLLFPWEELRGRFIDAVHDDFARWVSPDQSHFREQLLFAVGRFDEGAALLRYFALQGIAARSARVLDVGAGNGGVALALANCTRFSVHTLDIVPNNELMALRRALRLPVRPVVASGAAIPLADESLDIVLLIDTLEHLPDPRATGAEIMRVLRRGGFCYITTPARVPHLLRADPHYGIRGLALFPNGVQRFIVDRIYRRVPRYDVEHLFWHSAEVARMFPDPKRVEVLFSRNYSPPMSFRHATGAERREWIAHRLRGFFFDRIVIHKT